MMVWIVAVLAVVAFTTPAFAQADYFGWTSDIYNGAPKCSSPMLCDDSKWYGQATFKGVDGARYVAVDTSAPSYWQQAVNAQGVPCYQQGGYRTYCELAYWCPTLKAKIQIPPGSFPRTGYFSPTDFWPPDAKQRYVCDHPSGR